MFCFETCKDGAILLKKTRKNCCCEWILSKIKTSYISYNKCSFQDGKQKTTTIYIYTPFEKSLNFSPTELQSQWGQTIKPNCLTFLCLYVKRLQSNYPQNDANVYSWIQQLGIRPISFRCFFEHLDFFRPIPRCSMGWYIYLHLPPKLLKCG